MHDPQVVAFEIVRPWPRHSSMRSGKAEEPRWSFRYPHAKGWWDVRPRMVRRFWTLAGREFYWPALVTVWHCEPGGHDALTVCEHASRWRWHVHHWRIQVHMVQRIRRALLTRCEECGRKGSPNHSFQWDSERTPLWKGEKGLYHRECSELRTMRFARETDAELIRYLVAALRVERDESTAEAVARLTDPKVRGMEFKHANRLTRLMGFERDDDYNLVPKPTH